MSSLFAHSKGIVVQGSIEAFKNAELRAYVYEDYISFKERKIATSLIEDNKFRIEFDLPATQEIILKIEDKSAHIYVEPGNVYNLHLDYDSELNKSRIYDRFLSIEFSFPTPTDLNQLIADFNKEYDVFFKENYKKFMITGAKEEIKAFAEKMQAKEKYSQNSYLREYVNYAIANLELAAKEDRKKLKKKYLENEEILYTNREYMSFFKQYNQQRFRQFAISKSGSEMMKAIMFEEDLGKTLDIILKGEKYESRVLAELFLLNGLFEDFYVKTINQESNKNLLRQITEKGQNSQNKKIAKNILSSLELFSRGTKAPTFLLEDIDGNLIGLKNFKGKYIYLNFWASWSVPSLRELKVMNALYEKYNSKVEFVSINLDEDKEKMQKLMKEEKYPWTFLHYGKEYDIKEKYQIRTVPTYFLIDTEGKLKNAPAEGPVQIEEELFNINKK